MKLVSLELILTIVFIALLIIRPDYNYNLLNSGMYYTKYNNLNELKEKNQNVVYYKESRYGSVVIDDFSIGEEKIIPEQFKTVIKNYDEVTKEFVPYDKTRTLKINGRTQCGNGKLDMTTTTLLSAIPLALHNNAKTALNIGLGCGLTLSALREYNLDSIDSIEISRAVYNGVKYFDFVNNISMEDNVSKVHIIDARSFLYRNNKKYDIIISEPPPVWMRDATRAFSKEFLELLSDHLDDDGLLSQWVLANEMILRNGDILPFKIFYKTFDEVFPYNLGFISKTRFPKDSHIDGNKLVIDDYTQFYGEMILIGSKKPIKFDKNVEVNEKMQERFNRLGITNLSDYYVFASDDMEGYVDEDVPINTNDNSVLEFLVARNMYGSDSSSKIVDDIEKFKNSK